MRTTRRSASIASLRGEQRLLGRLTCTSRRLRPARHHRLQPGRAVARRRPPSRRRQRRRRNLRVDPPVHIVGHTWYDGFTLALDKRFSGRHQFLASYTLSKAEDESTDFQSAFVPQNNGQGPQRADADRTAGWIPAGDERGPSLQDQRHRFVLSGLYVAPKDVHVSSIITSRRAGRTTFWRAPISTATATAEPSRPIARAATRRRRPRASNATPERCPPVRASMCASRGSFRSQSEGRRSLRGLQPVQPDELHGNQQHLWGRRLSGSPLPTYGQFTQAGPPRQVQLAFKFTF